VDIHVAFSLQAHSQHGEERQLSSSFISVFNEVDAQNLFHNKYHHTYRCDDTRGCLMQF